MESPLHAAQRRLACAAKLDKLADFLERLPGNRFCYATWGATPDFIANARPTTKECGTVGCAAGWLDEASDGACEAWASGAISGEPIFISKRAEEYLGMDTTLKARRGEFDGYADFDRLFVDADGKLAATYTTTGLLGDVPKAAVIKRIRDCAIHYRKRAIKYLRAHDIV